MICAGKRGYDRALTLYCKHSDIAQNIITNLVGNGNGKKHGKWYNNRIYPIIIQIYMPARFVALRQRAMADYTINSYGVMV